MRSAILLTIFATVFAAVNSMALSSESSTKAMELIGQIGSKQYYEFNNNGEKVSWMGARQICEDENLEFGSTANSEEFKYLFSQRKVDYWVSGSLKGFAQDVYATHKAFEWIDGSEIVDEISFVHIPDFWECLYFSGDDHTYVDFCINGRHNVLCQKTVA